MIKLSDWHETVRQLAPDLDWTEIGKSDHFVHFYETDAFLMDLLSTFIEMGLKAGDACIVFATESHRKDLEARLEAYADITAAREGGHFVSYDAAETLLKFIGDDQSPDPGRFAETIGEIVSRGAKGERRVRVFGEMVALLWKDGNRNAAIQLEQLWNQLRETHQFALFCAYPLEVFLSHSLDSRLNDVCAQHVWVIPAESYSRLTDPNDRLRTVALLQQKARLLEAEVRQSKDVEQRLQISEIRYRSLFERSTDGILILDSETHIIADVNLSMLELLRTTRDQVLGKRLWEIGLFGNQEASQELVEELRDKGIVRCEHLQVDISGASRDVEIVGSIFRTNGHRIIQCNVRDITERKRAEELSSHLAAIVESSDDAIISKTLQGIILTWNKGAERIFGYSSEEVIGKPIYVLIPPDRVGEEPGILDRIKHGERIDPYETVRVTKDGRSVDVSLTVSPIKDKSGRIIAASKIARDITDRKRAEADLRRQAEIIEKLYEESQRERAEAEAANRTKDEFLATVSHELRTPLNAIIGWCYMLRKASTDEATTARAIGTIERSARAQAQLIEDILDVSRVMTGKLRLRIGSVDLISIIKTAIESVQLAANAKDIKLAMILDPSARHALGDPTRLQQVIWNLLSNAIKFTPPHGKVEVRLECVDSDAEIIVSDTGQGIGKDFLPFIFERFRQADGTITRRHSGLGLGLAIVRHLVELHGGTVQAQSAGSGCGATFTVKLPLLAESMQAKEKMRGIEGPLSNEGIGASGASGPSLPGLRVLLVDDDQDNLQMLSNVLKMCRAEVYLVQSAAEALAALRSYKPDVLVSDLAMPNEDGYSLISKVRALENGKQLPAVALTSYVRVEDRERALAAGFNMFVPKPIEPDELIAAILSLIDPS